MINQSIDYHQHLPSYRSLLNPSVKYDYQIHRFVPLSQNDLNSWSRLLKDQDNHNLTFDKIKSKSKRASNGIKMKYRSMLEDVSRSIRLTSIISNPSIKFHFQSKLIDLPPDILKIIFEYINDLPSYKACLLTCKQFYCLAKPWYYHDIKLDSTYRVAQLISYLRLNNQIGNYIKKIDLSGLKSGEIDLIDDIDNQEIHNFDNNQNYNNNNNHNHNYNHNHNNINNININTNNTTTTTNTTNNITTINNNTNYNPNFNPNHNNHINNNYNTNNNNNNNNNPTNNIDVDRFESEIDDFNVDEQVLAGWRDWKFLKNPLYSIHMNNSSQINKMNSIHSVKSNSSSSHMSSASLKSKFYSLTRRKKRRRKNNDVQIPTKSFAYNHQNHNESRDFSTHPFMNKYLLNYSTSKDLPVGYILHLINLCPNLIQLNLANLSLSSDYQVNPKMIYKYQTFDLMNNYPKDLITKIDKIMSSNLIESEEIYSNTFHCVGTTSSSSSSVYSFATFSKPMIPKYNSLLPPLPQTITDFSYLKKGDGKVYLSDLNLKSINPNFLIKVNEVEILNTILKVHDLRKFQLNSTNHKLSNLNYIDLSSMIWLNKSSVRDFLSKFIHKQLQSNLDLETQLQLQPIEFDDEEEEDDEDEFNNHQMHLILKQYKQNLILNLSDSGMYKLLPWAQKIDLNTYTGCKLAYRIINGILFDPFDEFVRRERIRRGRMGENYVS